MKVIGWIGFGLWLLALVISFQSGRSQAESPEKISPVSKQRASVSSPAQSSKGVIAEIEALLPERGELQQHDELWLLADAWAARDPEAAVAWLSELKFEDVRNPYLFAALSQWALQDPAAALAWLSGNQPEEQESREYLKAGIVRGIARQDPEAALDLLLAESKNFGRTTIDFILGAWAQAGGDRLLSGINGLPVDRSDLRILAFQKAAAHLSPAMQAEAREFSLTLKNPEEALALQTSLAERWASRSPEEALEWAQEISKPPVVGVVAKQWARQEPLAASTWLATKKGTADYDLSARAVAWSVVGIDPDLAFSQVEEMQLASLRLQTFEQLGRFWISDQPTQARAFFEGENPLPADLREALLSHFQ